jgi:hypothetical protein
MARLKTLPEHPRTNEPPILDAIQRWKRDCLLSDRSVFGNSLLWTKENLVILDERFTGNPIEGGDPFLDKLRRQLDSTPGPIKQLAAEILWLLLLFPANIGGPRKQYNITEVWSWSGEKLDSSHLLLALLDRGIGNAGQAYSQRRDLELSFAIRMTLVWKRTQAAETQMLIEDPWRFGNWIDSIPDASNRGFRHMILFMLFPDFYERTASGRQKNAIAAAFSNLTEAVVGDNSDSIGVSLDRKLFAIRKALERKYPNQELDFYRPPLVEMWEKPDNPADKNADSDGDSEETNQGSEAGPRFWIEKTLVKGRADREQGDHRLGAALWSPQKAKNGADIYKDMRAVREGDVVLHLIDNKHFAGISVASGLADSTFEGLPKTAWEGPAYRVPLRDYIT